MGQSLIIISLLTLVISCADAIGFTEAARVWRDGQFIWSSALKSLLGFIVGIPLYWWVASHMKTVGISAPALQVGGYFVVTVILVALFNGNFMGWAWSEKLVGTALLIGIAWLMVRVGG